MFSAGLWPGQPDTGWLHLKVVAASPGGSTWKQKAGVPKGRIRKWAKMASGGSPSGPSSSQEHAHSSGHPPQPQGGSKVGVFTVRRNAVRPVLLRGSDPGAGCRSSSRVKIKGLK